MSREHSQFTSACNRTQLKETGLNMGPVENEEYYQGLMQCPAAIGLRNER